MTYNLLIFIMKELSIIRIPIWKNYWPYI